MNRTRGSSYGLEMLQSTNSQKPHSLTLLTSLKRLVQSKLFWYKWETTSKKVTKFNNLTILIEQFQKLFKVLDAHRVSKRGMQEMMGDNKLEEHVEKYALYRIDLDWAMSSSLKLYESPIWMTLWRKHAKHTVRCTKLTRISRERIAGTHSSCWFLRGLVAARLLSRSGSTTAYWETSESFSSYRKWHATYSFNYFVNSYSPALFLLFTVRFASELHLNFNNN